MLTVVQHARIQNQKIDNERQIGQRKESKEKMKHHNTRLGPEVSHDNPKTKDGHHI